MECNATNLRLLVECCQVKMKVHLSLLWGRGERIADVS